MEPMTLGSGSSSPVSPGINPNFLPGFLIGDIPPSTPKMMPSQTRLSVGTPRQEDSFSEPRTLRQKLFNQSIQESSSSSPHFGRDFSVATEKVGPPKMGLFDTLDPMRKSTVNIMSSTVASPNETIGIPIDNISRIHPDDTVDSSRNISLSRLEKINTYWVTVFGFPPSAINVILSQLSHCGVILEKKVATQGNWMHVKFKNYNEVARALSLNGKCIGNIMIGMQLYYNNDDKENASVAGDIGTPIRARSLRHSFISPSNTSAVISPPPVPQKSNGIVTKAMEYMFGW